MNRAFKRVTYLVATVSLGVIAASTFALVTRASANSSPNSNPTPPVGRALVGITAANKAPIVTPTAAVLAQMAEPSGGGFGGALLNQIHRLPTTIAGHSVYVMPSASGDVCVFVEQLPAACGAPLSGDAPLLPETFDPDGSGGVGTTAFGIAEDGVDSLTLTVGGDKVTVPVMDNTFVFNGGSTVTPDDITSFTANFDSGQRVSIP